MLAKYSLNIKDKMIKETFYYNTSNPIESFYKSIYDLMIASKQCILEEEFKIPYFVDNIVNTAKNLEATVTNPDFFEKMEEGLNDMLEKCDIDLLDILDLEKLLEKLSSQSSSKLDNLYVRYLKVISDFNKNLKERVYQTIKYIKKQLIKNPSYEAILGMRILQSEISENDFNREKYMLHIELLKLQEYVKNNKKRVVITFDGRDAAGKGGAIACITENTNPKVFKTVSMDIPTDEENDNWFQTFRDKMPKPGKIVLFDRSWYNRAYLQIVMGFCTQEQYDDFMNKVNEFEEALKADGIIHIKIWLHINKPTQKYRFEMRKSNPLRFWKFSKNDEVSVGMWDSFSEYINKMLESTQNWNIIDSNDDKKSKLEAMRIIVRDLKYSQDHPSVLKESSLQSPNPIQNSKYIFLDLDGVLIPFEDHNLPDHEDFIDPSTWSTTAITYLNKLVEYTKSRIIIVSGYRKIHSIEDIHDAMKNAGFKGSLAGKIEGVMGHRSLVNANLAMQEDDESRAEVIYNYVKENGINKYVIIDDSDHGYSKLFTYQWIQPKSHIGISHGNYMQAMLTLQ